MITFIGPHVKATGSNDGVTSRVMAIDSLFAAQKRTYLSISFTKHIFMEKYIDNECTIIKCNYFIHFFFVLYMIARSRYVYIHTMMNYLRSMPIIIFKQHVIVDIHGVLVDELKYNGAPRWKIILYTFVEKLITRYSFKIICVTNQMKKYYIDKFKISNNKIEVLPIFSQSVDFNLVKNKDYDMKTIIYAGNLDKWQRVDEMLKLASTHPQFRYQFLVSNIDEFKKKMDKFCFDNIILNYDSVPKEKVIDYYKQASFGFVIRDNNILNKVSCPTKLVEYICNGIIPIMNDFQLGDFKGLRYISVEKFNNGNIPTENILRKMAYQNAILYSRIYNQAKLTVSFLQNIIMGK